MMVALPLAQAQHQSKCFMMATMQRTISDKKSTFPPFPSCVQSRTAAVTVANSQRLAVIAFLWLCLVHPVGSGEEE
jgi:hypothetical protein